MRTLYYRRRNDPEDKRAKSAHRGQSKVAVYLSKPNEQGTR